MKAQILSTKQVQRAIDQAFITYGHGVQIPIMDLGKIMQAGRDASRCPSHPVFSIHLAMKRAIEPYKVQQSQQETKNESVN